MLADTITCSRHGCTAVCSINVQQTLAKESTITNVSDRKADAAARQAASFEFSPQIVRIFFGEVADRKFRCACGGRRERHLPSGQARDPYGGGISSHQHAAQVHDGAVIKFPKIPSKEEIITSVNEPQADAAGRRWSDGADLLSKNEKLHP